MPLGRDFSARHPQHRLRQGPALVRPGRELLNPSPETPTFTVSRLDNRRCTTKECNISPVNSYLIGLLVKGASEDTSISARRQQACCMAMKPDSLGTAVQAHVQHNLSLVGLSQRQDINSSTNFIMVICSKSSAVPYTDLNQWPSFKSITIWELKPVLSCFDKPHRIVSLRNITKC